MASSWPGWRRKKEAAAVAARPQAHLCLPWRQVGADGAGVALQQPRQAPLRVAQVAAAAEGAVHLERRGFKSKLACSETELQSSDARNKQTKQAAER